MRKRGFGMSIPDLCNPVIAYCLVEGNHSETWGAGIFFNWGADGTIRHTVFRDNVCGLGGGGMVIDRPGTDPRIENCTFFRNWAPTAGGWNGGGGIVCHSGAEPEIVKCIFAENLGGGAMHCANGPQPLVIDCCFWDNTGGDALCGIDGGGNFVGDPMFCYGSLMLTEDSPCVVSPCEYMGALGVGCPAHDPQKVTDGDMMMGDHFRPLPSISPNPTSGTATINFELTHQTEVRVVVVDVQGRKLATPHMGTLTAGSHSVEWDGRTDEGRIVPRGVYYARIEDSEKYQARQIVLTQ